MAGSAAGGQQGEVVRLRGVVPMVGDAVAVEEFAQVQARAVGAGAEKPQPLEPGGGEQFAPAQEGGDPFLAERAREHEQLAHVGHAQAHDFRRLRATAGGHGRAAGEGVDVAQDRPRLVGDDQAFPAARGVDHVHPSAQDDEAVHRALADGDQVLPGLVGFRAAAGAGGGRFLVGQTGEGDGFAREFLRSEKGLARVFMRRAPYAVHAPDARQTALRPLK